MGIYLPEGYEPLSAHQVAQSYAEIIDQNFELKYYPDYFDCLHINPRNPHELFMDYIPPQNGLKLYINGVMYIEGLHFYVSRYQKKIVWKWLKNNGGFDLEDTFSFFAVYDVHFDENGLDDASNIVTVNN